MRRDFVKMTVAASVVMALAITSSSVALGRVQSDFDQCAGDKGTLYKQKGGLEVCKTVKVERTSAYTWTLAKTVSPASATLASGATQALTYTITATPTLATTQTVSGVVVVRNTSGTDVSGVRVEDILDLSDDKPRTTVLASSATVGAGGEQTYPYTLDIPATAKKGDATNTARVVASGRQATDVVHFDVAEPDNVLTYNRVVQLTDTFAPAPAGLTLQAPGDPGPWTVTAGDPASLVRVVTASVTNASLAAGVAGTITNTARLTSSGIPEIAGTPKQTAPAKPLDVTAIARTTISAPAPGGPGTFIVRKPPVKPVLSGGVCAKVSLSASVATPRKARGGGIVVLVVKVKNTGKNVARGVTLRQTLPPGLSFISATRGGTLRNGRVQIAVGSLRPGGSASAAVRVKIGGAATGPRVTAVTASAKCARAVTSRGTVRVLAVGPARVQPAVTG